MASVWNGGPECALASALDCSIVFPGDQNPGAYEMTIRRILFGLIFVFTCAAAPIAVAEGFDPVEATNAYLSSVSPEAEANTNAYVDAGYTIKVMGLVLELVVAGLLLRLGWSAKWRNLAERVVKWRFLQAFIYMPIYLVVTAIIGFPLAWYSGFYVERKFGLGTQDFGAWFVEQLQGLGIGIVAFSLFVAFLYLIIRLSPHRWWVWGSGLVISFMALLMLAGPVFIEPIFNEYRPMDEGPLKEQILSIARANGMSVDDVKQVDASKQTNRVSANVSGLFGTTRIALNDNLLNRTSPDGVEAVMAHEIGHYVLNHIWKTMTYFVLIFLAGFALASGAFNAIAKRRGSKWGVRDVGDYAGFPLLYAIAAVFFFVTTPMFNTLTRVHEVEADLFAINATQSPDAWAEVALLTSQYRKLHPPVWEEKYLNHHPSPYARIYMAMVWKAENLKTEMQEEEAEPLTPPA